MIVDEVSYVRSKDSPRIALRAGVSPLPTRQHRHHLNRGFEAWGEILGDAMVGAALMDLFVHRATMVTLKSKN